MKRPTLVCINFPENRATRYIHKPTGGFFTEEAMIGNAENPASKMSWGDEEGRRLLEEFRTGKAAAHQQQVDQELEQA